MTYWKHRDSELDRTCGEPTPITREYQHGFLGKMRSEFCASCDGDVYRVEQPQRDPELAWLDRQEAAPEGTMLSDADYPLVTATGRELSKADVEALADKAERGYDVSELVDRPNRRQEATPGGEDTRYTLHESWATPSDFGGYVVPSDADAQTDASPVDAATAEVWCRELDGEDAGILELIQPALGTWARATRTPEGDVIVRWAVEAARGGEDR